MPSGDELQVQIHYRVVEALQARDLQLSEAERLTHLGSWSWELATGEVTWSDEMYRIFGESPQAFAATSDDLMSRVRADHRVGVQAALTTVIDKSSPSCSYECVVVRPDGEECWVSVRADAVLDRTGAVMRIHGTCRDIDHERSAERALLERSRQICALARVSGDVVTLFASDGTVQFSNSPEEVLDPLGSDGARRWRRIKSDDADRVEAELTRLLGTPGATTAIEFGWERDDGSWGFAEGVGHNANDDPEIGGSAFTIRDITDRRATAAHYAHQALHDPLTGLSNWELFEDLSRRALVRAARHGWSTGILLVNIDRFRDVNEELGRDGGDELLGHVAQRLGAVFRASDVVARAPGAVARLGADEFLILCERVGSADVALLLAQRVSSALGQPFNLSAGPRSITASVGVALTGTGRHTVGELLVDADIAVRRAKARGHGQCEIFIDEMRTASTNKTERDLRLALERNEFRLEYQPKIALDTNRICGVEALLRWDHPERDVISPLEFIPLAEESGLIVAIGAWVIEEACRQTALWQQSCPGRPPLVTSVNVSARQFGADLADIASSALAAAGLAPSSLCLELTETILMGDADASIVALRALAAVGIGVSIDDFGTGFSSLAYLKRFPLDELKIDKSFIDGLGTDPDDTAIVAAIVGMAHALALRVVAEGVETAEQLRQLRNLGCDQVQGFFLSRPVPAASISALLAAEATVPGASQSGENISPGATDSYRPERIVIVDDAADVRHLVRMSLTAVGYEVHEAANGLEGIELAGRLQPSCILVDVSMPGLNGFDVCRTLRSMPSTADCTIIMLTANTDAVDKVEAFSAGADDYIMKPFSPRDLVSRIRSCLTRRQESAGSERSTVRP